jgi:hypothetical protein
MILNEIPDAGKYMASQVFALAKAKKEYCNGSGIGFYPVPVYFPRMLSKCIDLIQNEITKYYLKQENTKAEKLVQVRINLLKTVFEGDLGENHTGIFLKDHPKVIKLTKEEIKALPYYNFVMGMVAEENPFRLLGMLARNEKGSLEEAKALVETNLIKDDGEYGNLHLMEEVLHGQLADEIAEIVLSELEFSEQFIIGQINHDKLYSTVLN